MASNRTRTGGRRGANKPEAKACGKSEQSCWFCYSVYSLGSQIFTVLSKLPLTMRWPSGLNATRQTWALFLSVCSSWPLGFGPYSNPAPRIEDLSLSNSWLLAVGFVF